MLLKISEETVEKCFKHVEKIEDQYWEEDGLTISPVLPKIIIDPEETDSASDDFEYDVSDTEI